MMKLLHIFMPIFQFSSHFFSDEKQERDIDIFRANCIDLICEARQQAEQCVSSTDVRDAMYAVVVWLDEYVMRADSQWAAQWRKSLLQFHFFQSFVGGEAFFTRLEETESHRTDVHMVYLFCLLMGFQGKFGNNTDPLRTALINKEKALLPTSWRSWPNDTPLTDPSVSSSHSSRAVFWRYRTPALLAAPVLLYILLLLVGRLFLFGL